MCFLPEKESRVFINVFLDEEKDLVNEYDSDTGRIPSKTRMNALPVIKSIIQKWNATQTPIGVVHMTHNIYNIGASASCTIELSKTERSVALRLLEKYKKDLEKELASYPGPHTGALLSMRNDTETAADIIKKLKEENKCSKSKN